MNLESYERSISRTIGKLQTENRPLIWAFYFSILLMVFVILFAGYKSIHKRNFERKPAVVEAK